MLYARHAHHVAHGPNLTRQSFQFGPQSPYLPMFGLIFDGNTIKNGRNLTDLATFFGPP